MYSQFLYKDPLNSKKKIKKSQLLFVVVVSVALFITFGTKLRQGQK